MSGSAHLEPSDGDHREFAIYERLEHEIGVLLRRARGLSGVLGRAVHPQLEASAYGLLVRIQTVGQVRVTDLADFFAVGKPTVSRQISLLERQGLVTRARNSDDGRSRLLELTASGKSLLADTKAARRHAIAGHFVGWGSAELTAFADLLQRFNGG